MTATPTDTRKAAIVAALEPVLFRDGEWVDGPLDEVVRLLLPLIPTPEPDPDEILRVHAEQVYTVEIPLRQSTPHRPAICDYAFRCDLCDITGERWSHRDQADRDAYTHIYGEED